MVIDSHIMEVLRYQVTKKRQKWYFEEHTIKINVPPYGSLITKNVSLTKKLCLINFVLISFLNYLKKNVFKRLNLEIKWNFLFEKCDDICQNYSFCYSKKKIFLIRKLVFFLLIRSLKLLLLLHNYHKKPQKAALF